MPFIGPAPAVNGEFSVPFEPNRLALGSDGNMWVTLEGNNEGVAKITLDGTVTPYTSADSTGKRRNARGKRSPDR